MSKKKRRTSSSRAAARRREEARRKKQIRQISTIVVLVLAAIGIFLAVATFKPSTETEALTLPRDISVSQAYEYYQQGVFLLDVRTQEEWDEYHVPNAVLIPLDELPNRLAELPTGQPIMVICRSGNRSQVGRDILLQGGFNATSITGGIKAWASAGYPTE